MKVRVPVYGTTGKSVLIDPSSKSGATIGVDLKLPDGAIPTAGQLINALTKAAGGDGSGDAVDLTYYTRWDYPQTIKAQWDFQKPVRGADGTAALPEFTFTADTNSGFYRIGDNNIGLSTGGALRWDVSATRVRQNLPLLIEVGDPSTNNDIDALVISNLRSEGGGFRLRTFNTLGPQSQDAGNEFGMWEVGGVSGLSAATVGFRWHHDADVDGSGDLIFKSHYVSAAGTEVYRHTRDSAQMFFVGGSAAAPTVAFDAGTGMYSGTAGTIRFSCSGTQIIGATTATLALLVPARGIDGSFGTPSYSFSSDTNTGLYSVAADTIGVSTGGALRYQFGPSGQFGIGGATYGTTGQVFRSTGASTAPAWTSLTQPAAGLTISTGLTFALANDLAALEGLGSTGFPTRTATDTWAQRTFADVANRTTWTNPAGTAGNPSVDIAATYVGQTSITTLGTVTTGTWNGSVIGAAYIDQTAVYSWSGATHTWADNSEVRLGTGGDLRLYHNGSHSWARNDTGKLYLAINNNAEPTGLNTGVVVTAESLNFATTTPANFDFVQYSGSYTAPTALTNGTTMGSFRFRAHDGASTVTTLARMTAVASENHVSGSALGTRLDFANTSVGAVAAVVRLSLRNDQVTITDGVVGAPGLTFTLDSDTGFYRIGANNIGLSTAGTLKWDVSSTAITSTLPRQGQDGSFGTPAYSFSGDTNSGFYRIGADNVGLSLAGALAVDFSTTRLLLTGDLKLGTAGNGFYVKEGTNACMGAATMAAGAVVVNTTKVTANSRIFLSIQALGTVAAPKAIAVTARTAGTSFTITSADATDTSVVAWEIKEPA